KYTWKVNSDSNNEPIPEENVSNKKKQPTKRTATPTDSTSMTIHTRKKCSSYTNSNNEITPGDSNNKPY
ncbi:626_t:CDS:2, partial [Gigaspora rosea]